MAHSSLEIVVSQNGVEIARRITTNGEYVIGRDEAADFVVIGPQISMHHARLTIEDGEIYVEDLGSEAGTHVNGLAVKDSTRVWPAQEIRLGDATIEIHRLESGQATDDPSATVSGFVAQELVVERKYEIEKILRREAEGAVLDTHDQAIRRDLAMKVMKPGASEEDGARFVEEAQITGQLEHPGIPPIHELGSDEQGRPYYTMKLVRGVTLAKALELLAAGQSEALAKYPLLALLSILEKVCEAVAFAHSKGVIHRHLTPECLNCGDFGEVLVMDWEWAVRLGDQGAISSASRDYAPASLPYLAPEQARDEPAPADVRTDIYALGAILFHILTLRAPLLVDDAAAARQLVAAGRTDRLDLGRRYPHLPRQRVPDPLAAVVAKAMALDPTARYQRAGDLQADLLAYRHGTITAAEQVGPVRQFLHVVRRYKLVSTAAAIVVGASLFFGGAAVLAAISARRGAARDQAVVSNLRSKPPAFLRLAEHEADTQRFDQALNSLDAALAMDPAPPQPYWQRAFALLALERWDEAAVALRAADQRDHTGVNPARAIAATAKMKAMAKDPQRWKSDAAHELVNYLTIAGAGGPAFALASKMQENAEARRKLVDAHLRPLLGEGRYRLIAGRDGLVALDLAGQPLRSLEAVRGLPIDALDASGTALTDLEALRGMRLQALSLSHTKVASLAPLAGIPLRRLSLDHTRLQDLSPLKGAPLEMLNLENTRIYDLAILKGTPLRSLNLKNTVIRDLGILRGLPLESLNLAGMAVTDLAPLQNAPLKELDVRDCKKLTNFAAVLTLPRLERFSCDVFPEQLAPLRQNKTLQTIEAEAFAGEGMPGPRPPEIFWAAFDARPGAALR